MNGLPPSTGVGLQSNRSVHDHQPVHDRRSSPVIPEQARQRGKLRGSKIGRLLHPQKKLPVRQPHQNQASVRQPTSTHIHNRSAQPAYAHSFLQPAMVNPCSAEGVLTTLGHYSHRGTEGSRQLYQRLISPDISYQEVRKLAWDYQAYLPPELNHAAKMAWASRKAMMELQVNQGVPASTLKQSLAQNLSQRSVPDMYIHQALKTIDVNHPGPVKRPSGPALDHTPSLSRAEAVRLQQNYGVTAIPVTLKGKPVAYLLTRAPDKPQDSVLLSCHGAAFEARPKVLKPDDMTIRFAAPKDRVLYSSSTGFAEAYAKGHARFNTDVSQLYNQNRREVTDYYLEGSINTTPEIAAARLSQLGDQQEAVNQFDFLLLDRNVKDLHFSDLLQAFRESGIHPKQMINHHCRPLSQQSPGFNVSHTFDARETRRFDSNG